MVDLKGAPDSLSFATNDKWSPKPYTTEVVYMSSSFWLLDHAEEEITDFKAEQIHKMKTIFTQLSLLSKQSFLCLR